MTDVIDTLVLSIDTWNDVLGRLGEYVEGESINVTKRRKEHMELVANATKKIEEVNAIHDEVTKHRSTPDQRVIGFLLHSEKITAPVEPYFFTNDWALIELYDDRIDWPSFKGNKVYIGTSFYLFLHVAVLSSVLANYSFLRRW